MDKIKNINGEYDDWVSVDKFELDTEIDDNIQIIYCDTRDFAIGWNFEQPKICKKADCGFEVKQNKGLNSAMCYGGWLC